VNPAQPGAGSSSPCAVPLAGRAFPHQSTTTLCISLSGPLRPGVGGGRC